MMNKRIDCFFIGHNEMDFLVYEKLLLDCGTRSGLYRDLNLNFLIYKGKKLTISECYTILTQQIPPFRITETMSAAIAYLGSYVNRNGFSFDFVNSFVFDKEKIIETIENSDIGLVVILTTYYVTPIPIIEIISFIRKLKKNMKIVLGGPHIYNYFLANTHSYIHNIFDCDFFVISTQGESTLVNLLNALKKNEPLYKVDNLCFRAGKDFVINPVKPENNNIEENPVDWNLFKSKMRRFVNVRTSISCPFNCSFCGFHCREGEYQTNSVESIEKELLLIEKLGEVESVTFIDDTFNVPPDRFKNILKMLIRNKFSFDWNCQIRCQFVDDETAALLAESGCQGVFLGLESANNSILKNMNKRATAELYREGFEFLSKYNIITHTNFIIGFPGETEDTVRDTVTFIKELKPTFFRTQLWYCDPITPIWKERDRFQIQGQGFEWSHSTMDFSEACDLIDTIFIDEIESVWLPQYNFELDGIFAFMHNNYDLTQIKKFITAFNKGIKHKLLNPEKPDVHPQVMREMGEALWIDVKHV